MLLITHVFFMQQKYSGLTDAEVIASREQYGHNILTPPHKESLFIAFLKKFKDPLIIILLIAGLLSVGIAFYEYYGLGQGTSVFFEPVGIFVAIFLATGLAFAFEAKADHEFSLLNQVNDDEPVMVIRNGQTTQVARRDVVVGDIVIINTGDEIPADGTLLEATSLNVDESTLTGEPIAAKTTDPTHFDPDATFASNATMRGTKVMEGHGVMQVTAVGDHTENGKVFTAAQIDDGVKTPLSIQLDRLGSYISRGAYAVAAAIIVGRLIIYFVNYPFEWITFATTFIQTLMIAVALIVVAVPEGLPMAVTLSLAYSMRRMLRTNNLVRKLHACETMGATTVICTDKTGTLTQNRMQVYRADFFGNPPAEVIAQGIALNSTAQLDDSGAKPQVLGNPTEGALLLWLRDRGTDFRMLRQTSKVIDEIPFSTERKFMATAVETPAGKRILYVKGAPEIVFGMCSSTPGVTREEIDALLASYQAQAMRTLGFAWKELAEGEEVKAEGLTFAGIAAISDPVRADVPEAVSEVINAGISVKIVTGDTPGTAKEIGRQIGLWDDATDGPDNIITGAEFAELTDEQLMQRVEGLKIIARARPMDKKRLVEALQKLGEVVAVTGDGTNDAPALKAAHVGLSMGDGTSVAKEASDITIIDNSFASIGRAVMWGRSLYLNIQRFILFQMTVNVVACLIVLVGAFLGLESPLTVTQMLWVNLIMDTFAAMALASLPPSARVMSDKPRSRSAFIINKAMGREILGVGLFFTAVLLGLLIWMRGAGLTEYRLTVFFTVFVMLQFWNIFNARAFATGGSAFNLRGCDGFVMIAAAILAGQILIVQFGGELFSVTPLTLRDWLIIVFATSPVLLVPELFRHKGKAAATLLLLIAAVSAQAQKLEYGGEFATIFDNREGNAKHTAAETYFLTCLAPEVGVSFNHGEHRVMGGVVWTQPIGCEWDGHRVSPTLYYRYQTRRLRGSLGMFPRTQLLRPLPEYLVSDSTAYFQHNLRGALLQTLGSNGYFEFLLDWRGMQTTTRREAFSVVARGEYVRRHKVFVAGGTAMLNHLAKVKNAPADQYVVDNLNVNPYVGANFLPLLRQWRQWSALSVRIGALTSLTRDRMDHDWRSAVGVRAELDATYWRVTLRNVTWAGNKPLFPLYAKFGSLLNEGEPYYASRWYNRTELSALLVHYRRMVNLRAEMDFHFADRNDFMFYQRLILTVNI